MSSRGSDGKVTKDLTSLRREIRALLVTSKHGCTPKQLEDDYLRTMGECIPYHYLGYSSFMSLIYSMPDVVSVCRTRNNIVLYGVAQERSRKSRDQAKQKSKDRSDQDQGSFTPRASMITNTYKPRPKTPEVPSSFCVKLRELMSSHPNGIALKFFNEAFSKRFHYYIGFQNWGFDSLESMIESIPSVLRIHNDTTRNIKMVKRGEGERVGSSTPKRSSVNWLSLEQNRHRPPAVEAEVKQGQHPVEGGTRHRNRVEAKNHGTRNGKDSLHSLEELSPPQMKKRLLEDLQTPVKPEAGTEGKKRPVPQVVVSKVRRLLSANKSGIWVSRFLMEYKGYYEEVLDLKALSYSSVTHLLHAIPCCVIEKPAGSGDWLVYLKGQPRPIIGSGHKYHSGAYVSTELSRAVHRTLAGREEEGVALADFAKRFKEVNDLDFPMEEMGFGSTAELLQRVEGVEMKRPPSAKSVVVFKTASFLEEEKKEKEKLSQLSIPKKVLLDPRPSVYKLVDLPDPSPTRFQPVYVTEVATPSKLTVQLIGKETTQVLECLQEDMTRFYRSSEGKEFTLEETFVGQPCCASFNNDGFWYRAEVEGMKCSDLVRIRYVDYGNTCELPLTSLRRPKLNYLILPAQAVQCRLCHLKPAGGSWSLRANQLLKQMTKDLPLMAVVTAVQNRLLSLYLVDTSTSRDVYINDALVEQGLALTGQDSLQDEMGSEIYGLEGPLPGGDGRSVPQVRLPKDIPPKLAGATSSLLDRLPSKTVFPQQQHQQQQSEPLATSVQATPTSQPLATPQQPQGVQSQQSFKFVPGSSTSRHMLAHQATPIPQQAPPTSQHQGGALHSHAAPTFPPGMPLSFTPAAFPFWNQYQHYPPGLSGHAPEMPGHAPTIFDAPWQQKYPPVYPMQGHAHQQDMVYYDPTQQQQQPGRPLPPHCPTPLLNAFQPEGGLPQFPCFNPPPPGHAHSAHGNVAPPPGHAPSLSSTKPSSHTLWTQGHEAPVGHVTQATMCNGTTSSSGVATGGVGVATGGLGVVGTDALLDTISTPSSSDTEEGEEGKEKKMEADEKEGEGERVEEDEGKKGTESAVAMDTELFELQQRRKDLLLKMAEAPASEAMASLLQQLTAVFKDISIREAVSCTLPSSLSPAHTPAPTQALQPPSTEQQENTAAVSAAGKTEENGVAETYKTAEDSVNVVSGRGFGDDSTSEAMENDVGVVGGCGLGDGAETVENGVNVVSGCGLGGDPKTNESKDNGVGMTGGCGLGDDSDSVKMQVNDVSDEVGVSDKRLEVGQEGVQVQWFSLGEGSGDLQDTRSEGGGGEELCTDWDVVAVQDAGVVVSQEEQDTGQDTVVSQDVADLEEQDTGQDTVMSRDVAEEQDTGQDIVEVQDTVAASPEEQDTGQDAVLDQDTGAMGQDVAEKEDTVEDIVAEKDTVFAASQDVAEEQDTVQDTVAVQDAVVSHDVAKEQDTRQDTLINQDVGVVSQGMAEEQDTGQDTALNQDAGVVVSQDMDEEQDTAGQDIMLDHEAGQDKEVLVSADEQDSSSDQVRPTSSCPDTDNDPPLSSSLRPSSPTVPPGPALPDSGLSDPALPDSDLSDPALPILVEGAVPVMEQSSSNPATSQDSPEGSPPPPCVRNTSSLTSSTPHLTSTPVPTPSHVPTPPTSPARVQTPPTSPVRGQTPPTPPVRGQTPPTSPARVKPPAVTSLLLTNPLSTSLSLPTNPPTLPLLPSTSVPASPVDRKSHLLPTPYLPPATQRGVRAKRGPVGLGRGLSGRHSRKSTPCPPEERRGPGLLGGLAVVEGSQDPKSSANMHLL